MAEPAAQATNVWPTASLSQGRDPSACRPLVPLLLRPGRTPVISHDAMLPPVQDDVPRHLPVLVLSSDPLSAALIGAAIELGGYAPRFPQAGESARVALLRVRPRLVVVDCDHEDACSEGFIGPAIMTGSRVLLFRSRRTQRDARELSERLELRVMELPADQDQLVGVLHEIMV